MNAYQQNVVELIPNAVRSVSVDGTGVDVKDFNGVAHVILSTSAATAGTTPTLDVKLQESDALGSGYTDITGAAFTQVTDAADSTQMISFQVGEVKRYVRAVATIGGTVTPTFGFGVSMLAIRAAGRNASQAV